MKNIFLLGTMSVIIFIYSSCSVNTKSDSQSNEAIERSSNIVLSKEQLKLAGIEFGKIEKHILSNDIHAKGQLILPPQNIENISTLIDGKITDVNVCIGQKVEVNQILAWFTSVELISLQEEYLSSKSQLEYCETDYKRQLYLNDKHINSTKKLEEAKSAFDKCTFQLNALKEKLKLLNISMENLNKGIIKNVAPLKSKIHGIVNRINVNIGKKAAAGENLIEVLNKDRMFVELMIFEKDIMSIEIGQRVTFHVSDVEEKEYEASIRSIGGNVEKDGRFIRAIAQLNENSMKLIPGMFVAGEIHTKEQLLEALPEEAVIRDENGQLLTYYTMTGDNEATFEFVELPLKTGYVEDGYIQVEPLIKIPKNARIVIEGSYYIKSQQSLDEE